MHRPLVRCAALLSLLVAPGAFAREVASQPAPAAEASSAPAAPAPDGATVPTQVTEPSAQAVVQETPAQLEAPSAASTSAPAEESAEAARERRARRRLEILSGVHPTPAAPAAVEASPVVGPQDLHPGLRVGTQLLVGAGGLVGGALLTSGAVSGAMACGECALPAALTLMPIGGGLASALAVSLVGHLFTNESALLWTLGGGLAGGLASTALIGSPGVGLVAMVALPVAGSMIGYQLGLGEAFKAAGVPRGPTLTFAPFTRGAHSGLALAGTF